MKARRKRSSGRSNRSSLTKASRKWRAQTPWMVLLQTPHKPHVHVQSSLGHLYPDTGSSVSSRVESIRNVVLLAALSLFNLQIVFSIYARQPNETNHCVTRLLCRDTGSEALRRVVVGCRHSTTCPGLLGAGHIVQL